ncbi:hypothetical protein [Helicobacter sp. MIT 14-3879]|uniref:hypothetical protein n=1 Tax=Helicobacter sp. MIT 14-3879 TaxID=2040649 RepID=UPI000E1EF6D6|nr:hypothetical protein [Helicobacter sp. MIT 14-3879]RDU65022.1 hypothetical protein CQA44_01545 [Helicobacter sp. MIT 14-3879]
MFRIILSLSFVMIFAFAQNCDFSNKNQEECEIDIDNPPILLHKFVDDKNNIYMEYTACIYNGNAQIDDEEYSVIDCSIIENKKGYLTEGIVLNNDSNLIKTKLVNIKQNNILLRAAGDVIIDSGIRFNSKKPKNIILEIIEGTNNKSNLILQRGSLLNVSAIIMPKGKSNINLNTFYGGIYEKDFIDTINKDEAIQRGDMETALNVDNVFSISSDGEVTPYSDNLICGPEVNPLDIDNKKYFLKRLFKVKNTSKDKPSDTNSICNVDEGNCFDNLIAFSNKKIDEKSYKIAIARQNLIPNYDIFIEGGKISSNDNRNLKEIFPDAKISEQNYGKCNIPTTIAFSDEIKEKYLAKNTKTQENKEEQSLSLLASNENSKEDTIKDKESEDNVSKDLDSNIDKDSTNSTLKDEIKNDAKENDNLNNEPQKSTKEEITKDNTESKDVKADDKNLENTKQITTNDNLNKNDDFLIVEKDAYDKFNKECYGDLKCLYDSLLPYDKVIWTKKSSSKRIYTIYMINLSNNDLKLNCEIKDYYGKNIKKSYFLNTNNIVGKIDIRFPKSSNKSQIICKTDNNTKVTNTINVTPAKFDIKYNFIDDEIGMSPSIKAGDVKIEFKQSNALTMEGDIDHGFDGDLIATKDNVSFIQKNRCSNINDNVFITKDINLNFKNGKLQNEYIELVANTIALGNLNIEFNIKDNDKFCKNDELSIEPQCTNIKVSKDLNIIPANFRIKTDILSDNKISYYGQIEDRLTFKYNPMLNIQIEALNNKNEVIDINKNCNYGSIQLSLKNDKLIEFKRSASDRLDSKINLYLNDFDNDKNSNIKVYFGINKIVDEYKNTRDIKQNDVIEPQEILLTDLKFNLKFKNNEKTYNYDNLEIYDRLDNKSKPIGVIIARGKIKTNDIKGTTNNPASLILKYAIYCKTCDKKILSKYLQAEPEILSQNWYINTKHPKELYLPNEFIKFISEDKKNNLIIDNSLRALEGRQQINFSNKNIGIYPVNIAQRVSEFAPYLNYNENFKNIYLQNSFNVMINQADNKEENNKIIKEEKPKQQTPKAKKPSNPKKTNSPSIKLDIES